MYIYIIVTDRPDMILRKTIGKKPKNPMSSDDYICWK